MNGRIFVACSLIIIGTLCLGKADADLLNYWDFDNAGNVGQAVVGTDLTAQNGAQYSAAGYTGGALSLDGNDDYLGGAPTVVTGNGVYTTSAWIQPAATGGRGIVGWGNYGNTRQVNALRLDGGNNILNYWWSADLSRDAVANIDDGNWHHVATSYNGTTRTIYVNGQQIGSDNPGTNTASAANFRIGSTNNGEYFQGSIDSVSLHSDALAPNQIRALAAGTAPTALPDADYLVAQWVADDYTGGTWTDRVNSISATVDGAPTASANQMNGHASVRFDGDDAFVISAADSPMAHAADFSIVAVMKTDTAGAAGTNWYQNTGIVDMEMPGATRDWGLVLDDQGQIGAGLGGGDITFYSNESGLNDDAGHIAVYTRAGDQLALYIDGGVAQTAVGGNQDIRLANDFTIGRIQTGGNYYTGDIAEVRIYEGQLSPYDADGVAMDLAVTYGLTQATDWTAVGESSWHTAGNWSGGAVPSAINAAAIDNGGTADTFGGGIVAATISVGTGSTLKIEDQSRVHTTALTNSGSIEIYTAAQPGLVRTWYDGNDPTDTLPPENWNPSLTPVWDVDVDADTAWGGGDQPPAGFPGGSDEYYSLVYKGQVYVPADGTVAFREEVDDSTILYIDGVRQLMDVTNGSDMGEPAGDPWTVHATTSLSLTEGWHDIELRLGDHWGGQGGMLQWDPAGGTSWQTISGTSLRQGVPSEIGTAVVDGDFVQTADGILNIDIEAANLFDMLLISGDAYLDGLLNVRLLDGYEPAEGDSFEFMLVDGDMSGQFVSITGDVPTGLGWDAEYNQETGTITLQAVTIPEPATWAIFGLMGMAMFIINRRRR